MPPTSPPSLPRPVARAPLALLLAVLATVAASALTAGSARAALGPDWQWPVASPIEVLRAYTVPAGPYAAGHRGLDLAADLGSPVRAAAAGTVVFAGTVAGHPVVVLAHGSARTDDELRSTYEPVLAEVEVGRSIPAGATIGSVGAWPGHCGGQTCLHWGVRRGSAYLDPRSLIHRGVRLLALGPPVARSQVLVEPTGHPPMSSSAPASSTPAPRVVTASAPARGPFIAGTAAVVGLALGAASVLVPTIRTRRLPRPGRPRGSWP